MPAKMAARRVLPETSAGLLSERYQLGNMLGSGSFGEVWECFCLETRERLACKIISKRAVKSEEEWGDIQREVRVMLQLRGSCSGVVHVREALESDRAVQLVMELCRGGDLFDLLNAHGRLPEPAARHIFAQLVDSLRACHSRGIVHRDIKPENILLDSPALDLYRMAACNADCEASPGATVQAKLADFGLCVELKPGEKTTGYIGSRRYTAPELVLGKPYGRRADVWSLGVVLCAMLSGKLPFSGKTVHDDKGLREAIVAGRVNFALPAWKGVSQEAKEVVLRMLQVDPAKRITAFELATHPWVLGLPSTSPAASAAKENVPPAHFLGISCG